MNCPNCNAELIDEGVYGRLCAHQDGKVLGTIYRCPNHQGFETEEAALDYITETNQSIDEFGDGWEDISCASSMHSASGAFYTNTTEQLIEGYPC